MRLHHLLALNSWLAICILFLPISWGHVGEQGYVNYGPDVPDVYILGCYILGKDTQFVLGDFIRLEIPVDWNSEFPLS